MDTKLNVLLGNVSMNSMSITNGVHEEEDLDSEESTEKEFLTPNSSTPLRKSVLMSSRLSKSVRVESRPSPERLDAQLRQMVLRQVSFFFVYFFFLTPVLNPALFVIAGRVQSVDFQ